MTSEQGGLLLVMALKLLPYVAAVQQLTKHLVCQLLLCTTEARHTLPALSSLTANKAVARDLVAVACGGRDPLSSSTAAMDVCIMVQSA